MKRIALTLLVALALAQSLCAQDDRFALKRFYDFNHITAFRTTNSGNPRSVAFDGANVWVANSLNGTVDVFRASDGLLMCTAGVGGAPQGLAYDGAFMWVADFAGNTITAIQANTCDPDADDSVAPTTMSPITVGSNPYDIAFDGSNLWVSNFGSSNVLRIPIFNGVQIGPAALFNSGVSGPQGLAVDGTRVWVANGGNNTVVAFNMNAPPLSPPICSRPAAFINPAVLAFDGTSTLWIGYGPGTAAGNTISRVLTPSCSGPFSTTLTGMPSGSFSSGMAFDGRFLWVSQPFGSGGNVAKFDPVSSRVVIGNTRGNPFGLAFDGGNIWGAIFNGNPDPSLPAGGNGYVQKF